MFLFCIYNLFLIFVHNVSELIHNIHRFIHIFDRMGQLGLSNISTIFTRHISTAFVKIIIFFYGSFDLNFDIIFQIIYVNTLFCNYLLKKTFVWKPWICWLL